MNELMIFNNPEFGEIRTVEVNGEPWFVGKDVATALGYSNPRKALADHVDDEDKLQDDGVTIRDPIGRDQHPIVINESGLYSLVLSSKLPGAKKFKRWITSEVIPSIRKNGGYVNGQENMTPEELMAAALIMANKTIENQKVRLSTLTVENQIMQPKADYFDDLVDRNLLTGLRETAKELGIKPKEFISFLLSRKYLYRDKKGKLMPYQVHVNNGLFELKECFNEKTQWTGTQTLVTPKGRETFRLLFLKAG
jgi:prophage antirepressor-like protein|nr:MAG TPA: repressor domain protein [Caudoviricetes sp.]